MKLILLPKPIVQKILGKQNIMNTSYRMIRWCITVHIPDGTLLYNEVTRELLLIEKSDHIDDENVRKELIERWFLVPESFKDQQWMNDFYALLKVILSGKKAITNYMILPTTGCNARCYYCYQYGMQQISMSEQTALDTAAYMIEKCQGQELRVDWFGGEPLCNVHAIDVICESLKEGGIAYHSRMPSNGCLFNPPLIEKAKNLWNLEMVQITLDGTEEIYNKSKAYVYPKGNGYHIVMQNIKNLLTAGINVVIRLNIALHNAEDLRKLCSELAESFGSYRGFSVYPALLYENCGKNPVVFSAEQQKRRYEELNALRELLHNKRLLFPKSLGTDIRLSRCIADDENAIIVLPSGMLARCEHLLGGECVGDIYEGSVNQPVIDSWKEKYYGKECESCVYLPECRRLKKCPAVAQCTPLSLADKVRELELALIRTYENRRDQEAPA